MNYLLIVGVILSIVLIYFVYNYFTKTTEELSDIENVQEVEDEMKVYNFNTSWCKYSVMFAPEWTKFEDLVSSNPRIRALDVKCDDDKNEGICNNYNVPGFPSVVIEYNNNVELYEGERSAEALLKYVESKLN